MTVERTKLKRVLGFWDVFFIAVGQIIGAGIVSLTGVAIGMTGPSVIFAFFIAAILILIATILIIVAGTALPVTGAYYVWAARLGSGWLGSLVLFLIMLASLSLALYGSSFGHYLSPIFPILTANQWGIVVIALLAIANLFGLGLASRVQMICVFLLISALAIYAGFAIPKLDSNLLSPMFPLGITGFITAVFLLKFATGGAHLIVGIAGEMKDPVHTIPRVIILATLAVTFIYSFVALASVGVIPWIDMIDQPLTVAGRAFLPGWALTYFLLAGAGLAICTTVNAQLIQLPRLFLAASWDQLIPAWVGKINRYGAPYLILLMMLFIGIVPLLMDVEIATIARVATISASLPALIVYWVITRIPKLYPQAYAKSPFRLKQGWLWGLFAFSESMTIAGIVFLAADLPLSVLLMFTAWVAAGILYYPLRRYVLRRRGLDLDAMTSDGSIFENPRGLERS